MAPRGAKLDDVKTVESHVHALGQCRSMIRELGLKPIVDGRYRRRARIVAERGDQSAPLSPAARGRDLRARYPCRGRRGRRPITPRVSWCWRASRNGPTKSGTLVTTFVFRVRNVPAALYKALGGFATNGVNMTKLESYMVDGNFFATEFSADVDGHPDDQPLAFALEELKFFSRSADRRRLSGHPFRETFSETKE